MKHMLDVRLLKLKISHSAFSRVMSPTLGPRDP